MLIKRAKASRRFLARLRGSVRKRKRAALASFAVFSLASCAPVPHIPVKSPAGAQDPLPPTGQETGQDRSPSERAENRSTQEKYPYRIFCESVSGDRGLVTSTTRARPWDSNESVSIFDRKIQAQLIGISGLHAVESSTSPRFLFRAVSETLRNPETQAGNLPSQIYLASIDSKTRRGQAQELGASVAIDVNAVMQAMRLGLRPVNYGSSSEGRFLIVPGKDVLRVLAVDDLREIGTLRHDPARILFPEIDEATGTFTALRYQKGALVPVATKLNLTSGAFGVLRNLNPPQPADGRTALRAQRWTGGRLAWAEVSMHSRESRLSWVIWDPSKGEQTRSIFAAQEQDKILGSAVSFERNGVPVFVTAVERIEVLPTPHPSDPRAKVHSARLVFVAIEDGETRVLHEAPYPVEVVREIEVNGPSGWLAIQSLASSRDLKKIIAVLPTKAESMLFRWDIEGGIVPSGLGACANPAIIKESL